MEPIVFLNGQFVPYRDAVVPIEDRGLVFADGVYEVIRFYGGRPFELRAHLERLARSAAAIQLELPLGLPELEQAAVETVSRNGLADALLYLQVTRGVAPRAHAFPDPAVRPTLFMIARAFEPYPASYHAEGVAVITVPDVRWHMCHVKSIALLPNVLAKQRAKEAGAFEALFVRDGVLTEGSSSNLFIVRDRVLYTHPEGPYILSGITRRVVLRLAEAAGFEVRAEAFGLEALQAADEAFLTSTTVEVLPIARVDGRPVGSGQPGPVTRELQRRFAELTRAQAGATV